MKPDNARTRKFLIVGVAGSLVYFFVAWLLISLTVRPGLAAILAFTVAFLFAYSTQRRWTFASTERHSRLMPRYLAAQLLSMGASAAVAELAHHGSLHSSNVAVAALSTLVSGALSYLLSSRWVFSERPAD